MRDNMPGSRRAVMASLVTGLPVPAMSSALAYFNTMTRARGTANMVRAQRDYFGTDGFERLDLFGKDYHGPWLNQHLDR